MRVAGENEEKAKICVDGVWWVWLSVDCQQAMTPEAGEEVRPMKTMTTTTRRKHCFTLAQARYEYRNHIHGRTLEQFLRANRIGAPFTLNRFERKALWEALQQPRMIRFIGEMDISRAERLGVVTRQERLAADKRQSCYYENLILIRQEEEGLYD